MSRAYLAWCKLLREARLDPMVSVTKRNHIYLETVFQRTENYITCMYVAYRHTEIFSLVKLQWIASVGDIVWAGITLRLCSWQNTILWTAQTWPVKINKQQRMQPQYLICGYAQRFRIRRSEEHTSELQSPVPISYAVFCLKKKKKTKIKQLQNQHRAQITNSLA